MMKKCLAVGVICLLMMVAIPMMSGEQVLLNLGGEEHLYPKEEGPYNILIVGRSGSISNRENFPKILPFLNLKYPESIEINFFNPSLFFVNGKLQKVNFTAKIFLYGYKGYCPTELVFNEKYSRRFLLLGIVVILGQSDEMIAREYNHT